MNRPRIGPGLGLLFLVSASTLAETPRDSQAPEPAGVIVEEVTEGFAAHKAGIQPGDVLFGWERAASPPANPAAARGGLRSPFDLDEAELEQAPRGELRVEGLRGSEPLRVRLPPGEWRLRTRPELDTSELDTYEQAKLLIGSGESEQGITLWAELAATVAERGDPMTAAWLWVRVAETAGASHDWATAGRAFAEAQREAEASREAWLPPRIQESLASSLQKRRELVGAAAALQQALGARQESSSQSLGIAKCLEGLGDVAWYFGDLTSAEDYYRRSLTIRTKLAPQSLGALASLADLGKVATYRGDFATAEDYFRRALGLQEELAPQSLDVAGSLNNLGALVSYQGDMAMAESYLRRSLAITERLAPQSLFLVMNLNNLGLTVSERGDLAAAEDFHRRGLEILERLMPNSLEFARNLAWLGSLALQREDLATAEDHLRRALDIHQRLAPGGLTFADVQSRLAEVALARADPDSAVTLYERSLAIQREWAPGSVFEAEACQKIAAHHRQRHRLDRALEFYDCAIEAVEAQRSKLGGSDEIRSHFGANFASTYREAIDLHIELGRSEEAFHLLERYRARELLHLLAQRNLVFSHDIPEELEQRQRIANRNYDRAFGKWIQLSDRVGTDEREEVRAELTRVRHLQDEIRAEMRIASPRLAALQDPQPLDLPATRAALDPGTLLLSYSIGAERSYLFTVGPPTGELRVLPLATSEQALQEEVGRFRDALRRGRFDQRPEKSLLLSRRLSALLLAPAARQIGRADRLLILADGPLHAMPFASLIDPGAVGGRRFLVEALPVYHAASATVFALLKQERRERRATRLVAFGDPRYPLHAMREETAEPHLRTALRNGLDLPSLPATREEVERLHELYPQSSQIFLGARATESRAKAVDKATTHLHIASHGLLNDRFPLDSALALSIPLEWREGEDNGLLQAWEIFEQVRIDADLVTLSACDTGRGKVLGGEGLLGLTRAFQYAGARSVLASLWSVADASTGELMEGFYTYLDQGQSKAEALRSAQLDLLHDPELSHPFHWAGFELVGDWR